MTVVREWRKKHCLLTSTNSEINESSKIIKLWPTHHYRTPYWSQIPDWPRSQYWNSEGDKNDLPFKHFSNKEPIVVSCFYSQHYKHIAYIHTYLKHPNHHYFFQLTLRKWRCGPTSTYLTDELNVRRCPVERLWEYIKIKRLYNIPADMGKQFVLVALFQLLRNHWARINCGRIL